MDINSANAISDTAHAAASHAEENWLMHHIADGKELEFPPFGSIHLPELHLFGLDLSITRHVVFMVLAAVILIFILRMVANAYKKSKVPKGVGNLMEILIVFVRDEIAKPTIGKGYEMFMPFLLTAFFFILTCNFLGLVPYGSTATSNVSVTAALALLTFFTFIFGGIKHNGLFGYFKGLVPHGLPVVFIPFLFVIEVLGLLTKPFALAIRLFANMTAGHIVILALISLIFTLQTYAVAPVSVGFALFINLLELLVALLQAYIFTMLSSLFIGMAVHQDH